MSASIENLGSIESPGAGVFERLDSFIVAAKHLETTVATERSQNRRLREELAERELSSDRQKKDSEIRLREVSISESKLRAALTVFQENERKLIARSQSITAENQKVRGELNQYRSAWTDVLQREREAKSILDESAQTARRLAELEAVARDLSSTLGQERARREQVERHAQSYQAELKNALVRVHSAEVKFNELSKELNAHRIARRSMEEEVAEVEKNLRERFDWERIKERERLKMEMERTMAQEREHMRQGAVEQARLEFEPLITSDREQAAKALEAFASESTVLRSAVEQSNREKESIRRELNGKLMESQVAFASVETELRVALSVSASSKKDQTRVLELNLARESLVQELELSRNKTALNLARLNELEDEVASLRARHRSAGAQYDEISREKTNEAARGDSLAVALLQERERFEQMTRVLQVEVERLKNVNPIQALFQSKQADIERLQAKLNSGKDLSSDFRESLSRLFAEKDHLGARLVEYQSLVREKLEQIGKTREINALLSGPQNLEVL